MQSSTPNPAPDTAICGRRAVHDGARLALRRVAPQLPMLSAGVRSGGYLSNARSGGFSAAAVREGLVYDDTRGYAINAKPSANLFVLLQVPSVPLLAWRECPPIFPRQARGLARVHFLL
jgi:hypothetical protein